MTRIGTKWLAVLAGMLPLGAQHDGVGLGAPRPKLSEPARVALAKARELADAARGTAGPARAQALERAAAAHDRIAVEFAAEPLAAAAAAFAAAELWRQQGSLGLAEQGYLLAARLDAPRFGQRGLLGAADMQRRQHRPEEALQTYGLAAAAEPRTARAQQARLWQARILMAGERLDEAIPAFQAALESAELPGQVIEAANFLALAWIAKDDLEAAARAIGHAERAVEAVGDDDPIAVDRLHKALESMSARRALQRARDRQQGAAADAVRLDEHRRRTGS